MSAGVALHVDADAMLSTSTTYPKVAAIGQTEEQLKAAGFQPKVGKFPFTANSLAEVNPKAEGFVKVQADAKTDLILGVHMIGPQVPE